MASLGLAAEKSVSREQLRNFYLTAAASRPSAPPGAAPAGFALATATAAVERSYPLYFAENGIAPAAVPAIAVSDRSRSRRFHDSAGLFGTHCWRLRRSHLGIRLCRVSFVLDPALAAARSRLEMLHIPPTRNRERIRGVAEGYAERGAAGSFRGLTLPSRISAIWKWRGGKPADPSPSAASLQEYSTGLQALLAADYRKRLLALRPESSTAGSAPGRRHTPSKMFPRSPESASAGVQIHCSRWNWNGGRVVSRPWRRSRMRSSTSTGNPSVILDSRRPSAECGTPASNAANLCRKQLRHHTTILKRFGLPGLGNPRVCVRSKCSSGGFGFLLTGRWRNQMSSRHSRRS